LPQLLISVNGQNCRKKITKWEFFLTDDHYIVVMLGGIIMCV